MSATADQELDRRTDLPPPPAHHHGQRHGTAGVRLAALALVVAAAWYLPWLVTQVDLSVWWLSVPFLVANAMVVISVSLGLATSWTRTSPAPRPLTADEPVVAVLVPTYDEPVDMLRRTVTSVLAQDYPADRMVVLVGDDGRRPQVRALVDRLAAEHPAVRLRYYTAPPRGDERRRGEAKAGNLNAGLDLLDAEAQAGRLPQVRWVETRDADDEVGDRWFLRHCVGLLSADRGLAYVQTIKDVQASPRDPFVNREPMFYRGAMLGRHAANAVVPCGSGLVWRHEALVDIGGFPSWNLVEDLHSGVLAQRRGWRGAYLPVVGAIAQHAPEDLPGTYKQRGTWALDTVRLAVWGRQDGLRLRQRLAFLELPVFYAQSLAVLVLLVTPLLGLAFDVYPLETTQERFALRFWPFAIAVEAALVALATGLPFPVLLRSRMLWVGLAPVFARATVRAVLCGRSRKPVYVVTRKADAPGPHVREVAPHLVLLGATGLALAAGLVLRGQDVLLEADLGSAYWAVLFGLLTLGFLRLAWFWPATAGPRRSTVEPVRPSGAPAAPAVVLDLDAPVPHAAVVLPTRDEQEVIGLTLARLAAVLPAAGVPTEVVVVDDSDDDTPDEVRRAAASLGLPVRLVHRERGQRTGGLGGAVAAGFAATPAEVLAVMDADLQHPPEVLPELLRPLVGGLADLSLGTRFTAGGSTAGLDGPVRQLVSRGSRAVAAAALRDVRAVSDPLGGMFALRRDVVRGVELRPDGYKVLMEVLVRGRWSVAHEVGYTFAPRAAGTSQASVREGLRFLRHVVRLRSASTEPAPPATGRVVADRAAPAPAGPVPGPVAREREEVAA